MIDPLSEIVSLLQPGTGYSKIVTGAGAWTVRQPFAGHPFFCAALEGTCIIAFDGQAPMTLREGDFVLLPSNPGFTMSSHPALPDAPGTSPTSCEAGHLRMGEPDASPDVRLMGGYFKFASPDAALLVSLLPRIIHVNGETRLAALVKLVGDEARASRPAREVVMARLLEVLMIEALRSASASAASPGLLRGLADARLAAAIRQIHAAPAQPWTVAALAREAAMSRSTFFERFSQAVGMPPMQYLLEWRMALAKDLLRRGEARMAALAAHVGYSSASTFSTAFARHVGQPPSRYAAALRLPAAPLEAVGGDLEPVETVPG
jgi:AraC-like DNA-binding protein